MTHETASRTPRETIDLYYQYANAGRWNDWCSLFTEDMVMNEQLAGRIEGLARLRELMTGMDKMYSRFQNVPRNIVIDGETGTVVSHISANSASGDPIEAEVTNHFRFRDGSICFMENFHDVEPFAPVLNQGKAPATAQRYPVIHRFSGKFMEMPRDHVNAYIVELEKSVVVIDTTLALSSARALRAKAESFGKPLRAVMLTHGHPDHYTGLVEFSDVPRIASQGCLDFALQEDVVKSPTAKTYLGEDYPDQRLFPNEIVSDGAVYVFDGVSFTFRDLGPGESPSDGIWVVEKDGTKHVFVGDVMALNCHCFFRDGHTPEWNAVLERLRAEFDDSVRFYLGHGESPVGREVIDWQLGYNQTFLNAVSSLEDKSIPVDRPRQEQVIATMKRYLPNDATLFLLDYEMGVTLAQHIELLARRARTPRARVLPTEFAHVGITCKDPEALERFYVRHFGFERSRTVPLGNGERIVFLKSGNVHLELFQAKETAPLPPPDKDGYAFPGLRHLAFSVPDVDAKLAELGEDASIKLGPLSFDNILPGWRGAWVADPEGNIIELSQGYQDESPSPAPTEPRLMGEDWLVFEGEEFHHRETFSYEYDASGRKSRGRFENSEDGASYAISYAYDESGRATSEGWVNQAQPSDRYDITYTYDVHGRCSGGKGVGAKSWTYHYHHDRGLLTEMRSQYTRGPSWTFVYSYDDTGRRVLGKGTTTTGRSALITYTYQG